MSDETPQPQPADDQPWSDVKFNEWAQQAAMLLNERRRLGRNSASSEAISKDGMAAAVEADGDLPSSDSASLQDRLGELYGWRNNALAQLQAVIGWRNSIGSGEPSVLPTLQPQTMKIARRLMVATSRNEVRIAALEGAQRRWHASATAARAAIRLRGELAERAFGAAMRPDAQAHLHLAHATFMLEGNSPKLRRELRQAVDQNPKSKGLPYWLARYEIMVGNYAAAREMAQKAPNYAEVKKVVLPILETNKTQAPQQPFPSNYYTYRYQLLDDDSLRTMQQALTELANDTGLAETFRTFLSASQIEIATERLQSAAQASVGAIRALILWNQGNRDFLNSKYASATRNYADCQRAIIAYFAERYPQYKFSVPGPEEERHNYLDQLARKLVQYRPINTRNIWTHFRQRYMALTLDELYDHDWIQPKVTPEAIRFYDPLPNVEPGAISGEAFVLALIRLGIKLEILKSFADHPQKVEEKIDAPLLAIALVFTPLGIAEANRLRRNFDVALSECETLLARHQSVKILSEFIEKPFVKILKAQVLLDKADSQYKSRLPDDSPEFDANGQTRYQGLKAAKTYKGVLSLFEDQGQYVNSVRTGAGILMNNIDSLLQHNFHPLVAGNPALPNNLPAAGALERRLLLTIGKDMPIPGIQATSGQPHEI